MFRILPNAVDFIQRFFQFCTESSPAIIRIPIQELLLPKAKQGTVAFTSSLPGQAILFKSRAAALPSHSHWMRDIMLLNAIAPSGQSLF